MTPAFSNTYARLPERFFVRQDPASVPEPTLVRLNTGLAESLGLDAKWLAGKDGVAMLAGNVMPDGAEPLAMVYAGHQFGGWSPRLGDGRAILLGEVLAPDGSRHDLHLKGSGRTPYSRGGDGKAHLGAVLREYIISEAMAALGIPTTRALAAVATGETVLREQPMPGAVLTRTAQSHIRVGTFEYFASRDDTEALSALLGHVIERHYPAAGAAEVPALAMLDAVLHRQADLIAQWMSVGFIHGVMNTDNMSIAGESIDFGPCAFMDAYHPSTVFSSIDGQGRYAWANQPRIAHWNLAQLAQSLLPLIDGPPEQAAETAQSVLNRFPAAFQAAYGARFGAKIGLAALGEPEAGLMQDLLAMMATDAVDFTQAFTALTRGLAAADFGSFRALFGHAQEIDVWLEQWRARVGKEPAETAIARMRGANPVVIPRNHRVEAALEAAIAGDIGVFENLLSAIATPFTEARDLADYETPPQPEEIVTATYCGT